ncbi:hypothetical protein [Noviherbaspirillum malthae]|uniref:hypothetical protein n=1 Tax=Noviherbaspirillum malthae TaxID=1260987 RepID=UPI00188F489C|nr:hypothetical protein [Noviherbaspirillum malthae]
MDDLNKRICISTINHGKMRSVKIVIPDWVEFDDIPLDVTNMPAAGDPDGEPGELAKLAVCNLTATSILFVHLLQK